MTEITGMRVLSEQENIIHEFSFGPAALGVTEEIDGKLYRVIKNTQTIIVSYELVDEIVIDVPKLARLLLSYGCGNTDSNCIMDMLENEYALETRLAPYCKGEI